MSETTQDVTKDALEQEQEKLHSSLRELLLQFPGAPTADQLEAWKQEFGEIFCSAFSDDEVFIWRPLGRKEWTDRQVALAQMSQETDMVNVFELEEQIVRACILWGSEKGMKSLTTKAGSVSTLHEQLLQNSNFVDPRVASSLVVKL